MSDREAIDRLREWSADELHLGQSVRSHEPTYRNPAELRRDVRSLVADLERAERERDAFETALEMERDRSMTIAAAEAAVAAKNSTFGIHGGFDPDQRGPGLCPYCVHNTELAGAYNADREIEGSDLRAAVATKDAAIRLALNGIPDPMHPGIPAKFINGLVCAQIILNDALGDDDPGDVEAARAALVGSDPPCHICHQPKDAPGEVFCSYPHPLVGSDPAPLVCREALENEGIAVESDSETSMTEGAVTPWDQQTHRPREERMLTETPLESLRRKRIEALQAELAALSGTVTQLETERDEARRQQRIDEEQASDRLADWEQSQRDLSACRDALRRIASSPCQAFGYVCGECHSCIARAALGGGVSGDGEKRWGETLWMKPPLLSLQEDCWRCHRPKREHSPSELRCPAPGVSRSGEPGA